MKHAKQLNKFRCATERSCKRGRLGRWRRQTSASVRRQLDDALFGQSSGFRSLELLLEMQRVPDQWTIQATQIKLAKEKPIGSGNFADVYRGTLHRSRNKPKVVAVKIVRKNEKKRYDDQTVTITDEELSCLTEMNNEAMIMSLLRNPNVTDFYGISTDQMVMIVMEYCPGGSLDVHLQAMKATISNCERVQYTVEICSGMRYLEKKRVIHRDLATRNVLISAAGHLKIADFGLSLSPCVLGTKGSARNVPVRWMAPESLRATAEFTTKSDVWSFGVVCFEIFNYGIKPWPEKPVKWVATQIRRCQMVKMPNRMPRSIRELVTTCWKSVPADRPSFSRLHGSLLFMQNIRFAPPAPEKFTLNKPKVVTRIDLLDSDAAESLFIELDYVSSKSAEKERERERKPKHSRALSHEDQFAKDLSLRSVRDFVPKPGTPRGPSTMLVKKLSSEALNENDEDKDDVNTVIVTKETIEDMDPTDREK